MADLNGFDARVIEPSVGFEPLPAGQYLAIITASETKATKNGTGSYLEITFQVLEGDYKGRQLWARLNIENPNPTAVKFARAELSAICRAVGIMAPKDSLELHNIPLTITVAHKKREDNGELTNVIKGYAGKSAAPKAPPGPNGKAPWKK